MNSILYQTYSALSSKLQALSVLANNLSNVNSVGYKADRLFDEILYKAAGGDSRAGKGVPVTHSRSAIDFTPGPIQETGNPLHLALLGEGFFVLNTPKGTRYSRQGNFQVGNDGQLQTVDGNPVLGESGTIQIPNGQIEIDNTGHITAGGVEVAQLKIVDFPDRSKLVKEGSALFSAREAPGSAATVANPNLRQGALEGSNVNAVSQMARLMAVQREFESLQRTVQLSMNDLTLRLIDEASK